MKPKRPPKRKYSRFSLPVKSNFTLLISIDSNDIERGIVTKLFKLEQFHHKYTIGLIESRHSFEAPKKFEKLQLRISIARKGKKRGKDVCI